MRYLLFLLLPLLALVACDADDPTLDYQVQTAVGQVTLSGVDQQQREVLTSLLDNMVLVEQCQFWMGAQSRTTTRANYASAFTAGDSLKLTVSVNENGDTTFVKNNAFVDYVHLLDKRSYRHQMANGKYRSDTIYFTQVYRMPNTTGPDNGHLWVGPVTEMNMAGDYYIGRYEISQSEWEAVMGRGNWPRGRRCIDADANDRRDSAWYSVVGKGADYPAYNVWYDDAVAFCKRLNEICGMPNAQGYSFRLPTEAEWECAARGGRYCRGYIYPGSDSYTEVAWCSGNAFTQGKGGKNFGMHAHGELKANELGIYDMSGNVSEWCQNAYYRYTYRDSICNEAFNQRHQPLHAAEGYVGDTLILRGGSWYQSSSASFNPAGRQEYTRGMNDADQLQSLIMHCGFRVVLAK